MGTAITTACSPVRRVVIPSLTYGLSVAITALKYDGRTTFTFAAVLVALLETRESPAVSIQPMPPVKPFAASAARA